MSAFSQLIASIGKPQAPSGEATSQPQPTNGLVANNAAAGVKRKPDEPSAAPPPKTIRTEQAPPAARPTAPSNRFQLSAKGSAGQKPTGVPNRPSPKLATSSSPPKHAPKPLQRPSASNSPAPAANAHGAAPPAKRGFASIMAKAKAAQEAAKAAGPGLIKHKPVEKLSRRERARLAEEQKAQRKAAGKGVKAAAGAAAPGDRSRSGTPVVPGQNKKGAELSYKGTMKKPTIERQPLAYKGTMRSVDPAAAREKEKKRLADDKYGGYANWSDLSDADDGEDEEEEEEEEEEGYDSEGSSDMEGGFDDVEKEEMSALRAAKKEDEEALAEEERLKREKEARKRKLLQLSKSAAARKKY